MGDQVDSTVAGNQYAAGNQVHLAAPHPRPHSIWGTLVHSTHSALYSVQDPALGDQIVEDRIAVDVGMDSHHRGCTLVGSCHLAGVGLGLRDIAAAVGNRGCTIAAAGNAVGVGSGRGRR